MKNKKSIVDTIKQFLKKNIPETSIVLDTTITGCGYDSKPEDEPLAGMPPTETQNNPANVEKIEFDDNDFNDDLTWLAASGYKKLSDFIKYAEKKYGHNLQNIKIDVVLGNSEEDAECKRRKAHAILGGFWSVRYSTISGLDLDMEFVIAEKIAEALGLVEKIEFADNDFNDDLTRLSTSGDKKLSDFTKYVKEKYGYDLRNINIDIMWGDEDTERKRRKARVIFGEFSHVYSTTPGTCLTVEYIIAGKIANTLDREFNFMNRGRR